MTIGSLFVGARCRAGFVSRVRGNEPVILRLWCGYSALAGIAVLIAILLPGWLAAM